MNWSDLEKLHPNSLDDSSVSVAASLLLGCLNHNVPKHNGDARYTHLPTVLREHTANCLSAATIMAAGLPEGSTDKLTAHLVMFFTLKDNKLSRHALIDLYGPDGSRATVHSGHEGNIAEGPGKLQRALINSDVLEGGQGGWAIDSPIRGIKSGAGAAPAALLDLHETGSRAMVAVSQPNIRHYLAVECPTLFDAAD